MRIAALLLGPVAVLFAATLSVPALAAACPYAAGQEIDAEWWSNYASWHPAVVVRVEGSGETCAVFFRYLEAPEGVALDRDWVLSLAHSHLRPAQLPRGSDGVDDPAYHQCKGTKAAAYFAAAPSNDPVDILRRAVVLRWDAEFGETLGGIDFKTFEVGTPFVNDFKGTWHFSAPAGATVFPIVANETICIQRRTSSHTATYDAEYRCYIDVTDRMQCDRPTFFLRDEEFRDKVE